MYVCSRAELLRNGFIEEIGLPMTESGCETDSSKFNGKKNGGPAMGRVIGE